MNKRGKRDAATMGTRLRGRDVNPDLIICSPAKRALETAKAIAREISYQNDRIAVEDTIYEAEAYGILELIKGLDDSHNEVMLVGHNPAFSELAASLESEPLGNMPTCSVFCIDFKVDTWREIATEKGRLVFFDYPKNVPQ